MTTNDKERIKKALIVAQGMGQMSADEVQDELDKLETGPALRVISLGWGLQSWVLAAMSAQGELEPVDFAIHSDTTWERAATYEFAERWTPWLEERGVRVITVDDAAQAKRVYTKKTDIPAFTSGDTEPVFIPAFSRDVSGGGTSMGV